MKFLQRAKDGGPESPVIGYFLVEIKSLFSIVLLHFTGTREAYHSHAFNAITLWLNGAVREYVFKSKTSFHTQAWFKGDIKYTPRGLTHKIKPLSPTAWAISVRGPWAKYWSETFPELNKRVTLTHGREIVEEQPLHA